MTTALAPSPSRRQAFLERLRLGMTYRAIATAVGCSVSYVCQVAHTPSPRPSAKAAPWAVCLHCGAPDPEAPLWICPSCSAVRGVRRLYRTRSRRRSPEWEERLRRVAERAALQLPLFDGTLTPSPDRRFAC